MIKKSWTLFIDTSIFYRLNFNTSSKLLTIIKEFCKSGKVKIILTDITIEEIKSKLSEVIRKAKSSIHKMESDIKILKNVDSNKYKFLFEPLEEKEIFDQLFGKISDYFKQCNVEILKATEIVNPKIVFSDYFQGKPPFGEGKKKHEFPDAFVIAALNSYCNSQKTKIYIVSGDHDFKKVSSINKNLIYIESLEKFIELVLSNRNGLIEFIHILINKNKEKISEAVAREVKRQEMVVMDADPDADAEAFIVGATIIDLYKISVIKIIKNTAIVRGTVRAILNILVKRNDPYYLYKYLLEDDPIDLMYYYSDKIEDTYNREMDFDVEFRVEFERMSTDNIKVLGVILNRGESLKFYLYKDKKPFIYKP